MEIRFLSTGSGNHCELKGSPAILVEERDTTLLMGCGLGTIHHLYRQKLPSPAHITGCCIPRITIEHVGDLIPLLVQRSEYFTSEEAGKPMIIRGPAGLAASVFNVGYNLCGNKAPKLFPPTGTIKEHDPSDQAFTPVHAGCLTVTSVELDHRSHTGYSVQHPDTGAKVVYMGVLDEIPTGNFWNVCAKPSILIMPGPTIDLQQGCRLVKEMVTRLEPKKTILISCDPVRWSQAQPFFNVHLKGVDLAPAETSHPYKVKN